VEWNTCKRYDKWCFFLLSLLLRRLTVYPLLPAKPFEEVQGVVADLMKDRILVGHAIQNDLKVRFTLFLLAHGAQFLPLRPSCSHIRGRKFVTRNF
jgi:hypothetical protein